MFLFSAREIKASVITLTSLTTTAGSNGLSANNIYPQNGVILLGLQLVNTTGAVTINGLTLPVSNFTNLATYFSNAKIYLTTNSTYPMGTVTQIAGAGVSGPVLTIGTNSITVTGMTVSMPSAATRYIFVVLDYTYTGATASGGAFNNPVVAYASTTASSFGSGPYYNTLPTSVALAGNATGLTSNATAFAPGATNLRLFSFSVTVAGQASFNAFNLTSVGVSGTIYSTPDQYLGNGKLYVNTTATMTGATQIAGAGVAGTTVTFSGADVRITGLSQSYSSATAVTRYYFLQADYIVYTGINPGGLQFAFNTSQTYPEISQTAPTVSTSSPLNYTGSLYSFAASLTVTALPNTTASGYNQSVLNYGDPASVVMAISITTVGTLTVNRLSFTNIGTPASNPSAIFGTGILYSGTTANFADASVVPGALYEPNAFANSLNFNTLSQPINNSTRYYFIVVTYDNINITTDRTFQLRMSTNASTPHGGVYQSTPVANYNTSTAAGPTFNIGVTYDWASSSGGSTDFTAAANYRNLNNGALTTAPSQYDHVRIGVVKYANNSAEPIVTSSYTIAKLTMGTLGSSAATAAQPILTVNSFASTFEITGGINTIANSNPLIVATNNYVDIGTVGGTSSIAANTTLTLTGGGYTFSDILNIETGANVTHTGSIQRGFTTSGTVNMNGTGSWSESYILANSGTFNMNGSGTLSVGDDFTNSSTGTFTATAGTVNFNGATAQDVTNSNTTTPVAFYNATFSGGNTKTLSGTGKFTVNPVGVLTMAGSTTLDGGALKMTLLSTASGSAAVEIIPAGARIIGTFNAQRFFTGGLDATNRGWRALSSPVNVTNAPTLTSGTYSTPAASYVSFANIKNGAYIVGTGSTGGGFSAYNANSTLYLYKETLTASTSTTSFTDGKYLGVTSIGSPAVNIVHSVAANSQTNVSVPIGNGFLFFFVGNNTRTSGSANAPGGPPQDAIITYPGYINQGNITVNLWYGTAGQLSKTAGLGTTKSGYCFLGNPYPSAINLTTVVSNNSGVVDNAYVLNTRTLGISQDFIAYSNTGGTSSPLTPQFVVSGGGFLVHATSAGAFTFREAQKAATTQLTGPSLIMSTPRAEVLTVDGKVGGSALSTAQQNLMALPPQTEDQPLTGLYMKLEKDAQTFSYCGIYYGKNYNAKYEDGDAQYIPGPSTPVSMSSMSSDGLKMAINNLPDYHNGSKVKLNVTANVTGLYNLKLEGIRNIDELYDIYLLDHYKKDSLDIRRYGTYSFNLNRADTATFGANRFELSIRLKPLPQYLLTNFAGSKITEGVNLNWKTVNESNYTGFTLEKLNKASSTYESIYDKQSDGGANYGYIDHMPTSGINTYRLKQNDAYGKTSYSEPITIFYDKLAGNGLINVFPNPTTQMINVNIPVTMAAPSYKLKVYNSSGNIVLQQTSNTQYWTQSVSHLQTGVYVVQVDKSDGTTLGKVKFVKQ